MKILILNWRDFKSPVGGGAEILTHEMAKRWAKWGHEVVQFSAMFPGGKREEVIDRVKIIRHGFTNIRSFHLPVHLAAFCWYQKKGKSKFDVVIDEIHGLPFFTPLYVREKKVALICEVASEIWDVNFKFPLNKLGRFVENNYFRFYQNTPFLTISPSTKKDLIAMGIEEKKITILPMGITVPDKLKKYPKEKRPTLIFVGRLSKAKGIEDAIQMISLVKKEYRQVKLWVVGQKNGQYLQKLKKTVKKLNLEENIKFFGFVNEKKKFELMSRAHILVASSIKEGWGLTVPETGLVGTPAVGYNVPGLRDVIKNEVNGILVPPRVKAMTKEVNLLLAETKRYKKLQKGAIREAKKYNWDETAKRALRVL